MMLDFTKTAVEEDKNAALADAMSKALDDALVQFNKKKAEERYKDRPKSLGGGRIGFPLARGFDKGCERALFYEYKQYEKDEGRDFSAQLYRVFDMGHDGEERMAGYLRQAGFNLLTENQQGEQFGFTRFPDPETGIPRMRGYCDGVFVGGPDTLGGQPLQYPFLWECKALKGKKWTEMNNKGVIVSHPTYYAQVQLYMGVMNLTAFPALLTAINRDTGEIAYKFIPYVESHAQAVIDRAIRVLAAKAPTELPRATNDYNQLPCKWCDYRNTCQKNEETNRTPTAQPTFWNKE